MILPASYLNGFAPRDGQPLYPSLWKGCVGAWNPGLGPSGLVLRDQSGFKNNGTLTNGPTFAASQGRYAMNFDGVNDLIVVPNSPRFVTAQNYAISLWVKPDDVSGLHSIVSQWDSTNGAYAFTSGSSLLFQSGNSGHRITVTNVFSINAWVHLIVMNRNGLTSAAINGGISSITTPALATSATSQLLISTNNLGGVGHWLGQQDDLRWYDRNLSPQEIRLLATRRGIAYEMAPRRRSSTQVTVAPLRYNLFSGSVGNTDVIGAS